MISTETRNLLHPQVDRVVKDHESRFWMIAAAPAGVSAALMMNAGASPAMADNVMPSLSMNMPLPYEQESWASAETDPLLRHWKSSEDRISSKTPDVSSDEMSTRIHTHVPANGSAWKVLEPFDDRCEAQMHGILTPYKTALVSGKLSDYLNLGAVCLWGSEEYGGADDFFIARIGDKMIAGVCDGHGENGDECAAKTSTILLDSWLDAEKKAEEGKSADPLEIAFVAAAPTSDELESLHGGAGSAAIAVTINADGRVECRNLGGSRAIIVREDGSTQDLSHDHIVANPNAESGATVADGIKSSRSYANLVAKDMEERCTPERQSYQLQDNDRYLIVASSGLWSACPDGTKSRDSDFVGLFVKYCMDLGYSPPDIALALSHWPGALWDDEGRLSFDPPGRDTTIVAIPLRNGEIPPSRSWQAKTTSTSPEPNSDSFDETLKGRMKQCIKEGLVPTAW